MFAHKNMSACSEAKVKLKDCINISRCIHISCLYITKVWIDQKCDHTYANKV